MTSRATVTRGNVVLICHAGAASPPSASGRLIASNLASVGINLHHCYITAEVAMRSAHSRPDCAPNLAESRVVSRCSPRAPLTGGGRSHDHNSIRAFQATLRHTVAAAAAAVSPPPLPTHSRLQLSRNWCSLNVTLVPSSYRFVPSSLFSVFYRLVAVLLGFIVRSLLR